MLRKGLQFLGFSGLAWLGLALGAYAQHDPHVLAGMVENDLLYNPAPGAHQDRHYTQGLKLIYLDRGEPLPCWAASLRLDRLAGLLPNVALEPHGTNYAFVLGQNIYTPEDDRSTNVVATDRPYAGWLYTGLAIQRRGETAAQTPVMENFELNLGIIGPEAQGEWAQNTVHQVRRLPLFEGWRNQLKTEPAFVFKYGRAWRLSPGEETGRYLDFLPHFGLNLGTVMVSGGAGATLRLGWNLPDDFGVQTIDSPILLTSGKRRGPIGFYIFGRVDGRALARNAFLDGNLYQKSHHVDKQPLVADLSYGAALGIGRRCEFSWTLTTRTEEFEGQQGFDQFGSLTATFKWGF